MSRDPLRELCDRHGGQGHRVYAVNIRVTAREALVGVPIAALLALIGATALWLIGAHGQAGVWAAGCTAVIVRNIWTVIRCYRAVAPKWPNGDPPSGTGSGDS
jgi:hypothetical protein